MTPLTRYLQEQAKRHERAIGRRYRLEPGAHVTEGPHGGRVVRRKEKERKR